MRKLQSTQAHISIWSLLASSTSHREAFIKALSQIRIDTTTSPKGLIHMLKVDRATCIVFSDDDFPPKGVDHTHALHIFVSFSWHLAPYVLLDNGSSLNVVHLPQPFLLDLDPLILLDS